MSLSRQQTDTISNQIISYHVIFGSKINYRFLKYITSLKKLKKKNKLKFTKDKAMNYY